MTPLVVVFVHITTVGRTTMGQYHLLANLDAQEWVSPHRLGLGAKQLEHTGAFHGTFADALYLLTMTSPARGGGDWPETPMSGRWAGARVAVVGDYTGDDDLPGVPNAGTLYGQIEESWTDISDHVAHAMEQIFGFTITGQTTTIHGVAGDHAFTLWNRQDPPA